MSFRIFWTALAVVLLGLAARQTHAQSFGIELHNTLMPASGGMAGASIANPQDVTSAFGANPATLSRFDGTQFTFGGAWVESTYNMSHTGGVLPNLGPFFGKSEAEGSAMGNIAVSQELDMMGIPATFGVGLMANAGAGVNFRHIPNSNGTSVSMAILGIAPSLAVDLTDRFSVGANLILGSATLDAPFQGISAATLAYALRGTVGFNYDAGCDTSLGFYYQTSQNFNFDNAIRLQLPNGFSPAVDLNAGLPANYGLGVANESLMDGRLLLAMDVLFKDWNSAYLFGDLYENQWVFQLGAQYEMNPRIKLRLGYAYAENPIDQTLGSSAGGIIPPVQAQAALQYVQATVAVIGEHRLTCGVGIRDALPGVDFDLMAGGMLPAEQEFGAFTSASIQSYWAGAGFTWRFGRGACERLPSTDDCGGCK